MADKDARANGPAAQGEALARELERLLAALAGEHERLRAITAARRAALSRADAVALGACTTDENEVVQRIALLDKERATLALVAARAFGLPATESPTLSWIAANVPESRRGSLMAAAGRLRDLIATVRHERAAVGQAADALANHMRGILRAVEQRLTGAAAYSRSGTAPALAGALCALDMTS